MNFYKVKSFYFVPLSHQTLSSSSGSFHCIFHVWALVNSLFFFIEFVSGSVSELTADDVL